MSFIAPNIAKASKYDKNTATSKICRKSLLWLRAILQRCIIVEEVLIHMKRSEIAEAQRRAVEIFRKANIILTDAEKAAIEVADFGLNDLEHTGLEIVTYVNTQRVCAKEMAMFPHQTCPQHRHPSVNGMQGKEETFRCRWGKVYVYVSGEPTAVRAAEPPKGAYDVFHEIVLEPGMQYTLAPDTWHWFQAGEEGAVVSEFSTHSTDENDIFLDQNIVRIPEIEED